MAGIHDLLRLQSYVGPENGRLAAHCEIGKGPDHPGLLGCRVMHGVLGDCDPASIGHVREFLACAQTDKIIEGQAALLTVRGAPIGGARKRTSSKIRRKARHRRKARPKTPSAPGRDCRRAPPALSGAL